MKIGELAERTTVPTKTIRYWESEGLVPEPARTPSGYRDYDDAAVDRVGFIRQSQTAGLTLAQIRQILEVSDEGTAAVRARRPRRSPLASPRSTPASRELEATRTHLRRLAERAARAGPRRLRRLLLDHRGLTHGCGARRARPRQ